MKNKGKRFLWVLLFSCSCSYACKVNPDDTPNTVIANRMVISPSISAEGDELVATDQYGRTLPGYDEAGDEKADAYVGLFYWLWHGSLRNASPDDFDVTKALKKNPARTQWDFADYYWAEPELGYYKSDDIFVMQKHLNLFCLLGIDFLYLDFTNAVVDANELHILLGLMLEMKQKGYHPPRIVPFLNSEPVPKIEELYRDFYSKPEYNDCWFIYDGKPLILSPEKHPTDMDINNKFTYRKMWAGFEANESTDSWWRFFDNVPKSPAYYKGKVEQMVVSPGFGAPLWDNPTYGSKSSTSTSAPVYDVYWKTPDMGKGLFFEEQWKEAHLTHPTILCITGWNEWKAGAWYADQGLVDARFKFQERFLQAGEMYFVDEFNEEFNRDLEPQAGEYSDNYFYQLAAHLRRYKGMKPKQATSPAKTIVVDGRFEEWTAVTPVFKDFAGELKERDHAGAPRGIVYQNHTARNDIVESRVTYDDNNIYFYVKTLDPISTWQGKNWMLLYIDADRDRNTGWEGYDFVVNLEKLSSSETTLYRRNGTEWEKLATCSYRYANNEMEIAVPKSDLQQSDVPDFYFHWVDNIQQLDDINEFFVNGESAPERRYNYHFQGKK